MTPEITAPTYEGDKSWTPLRKQPIAQTSRDRADTYPRGRSVWPVSSMTRRARREFQKLFLGTSLGVRPVAASRRDPTFGISGAKRMENR